MSRGVLHYASAPCLTAAQVAGRIALRGIQVVRRLLFVVAMATALLLNPPVADAAGQVPYQDAQLVSQSYGAWSCRGVYHVVRRGETLYSIARRYRTTAYRIAVCNGLGSYTVYVGQTLLVPVTR